MKTVLLLLHLLAIGWIGVLMWRRENVLKKIFFPALVVKVAAGIAVGLLYEFYYTSGDTWLYFRDGQLLASLARSDFQGYWQLLWASEGDLPATTTYGFQEPRALFFVKVVSVFNLLSLDNYWVISVYFSFFSFLGAWFLLRQLTAQMPNAKLPGAVGLLFFPSLVFWSAGLIKESLAMAGLYFLAGIFIRVWFSQKFRLSYLLPLVLSVWVVWNLKYYYAAVFFAVVITSLGYKYASNRLHFRRSFSGECGIWLLIFFLALALVSLLHPNFSPQRLLSVIVDNNESYSVISAPEDQVQFYSLQRAWGSLILNSPWALVSGLFRPFIWESGNILQFMISLENLLLLTVFVVAILKAGQLSKSNQRVLVFAVIVYVILLAVFITLSTPNFGTLSRYRVGYLPFFITLVLSARPVLNVLERSFNRLVR